MAIETDQAQKTKLADKLRYFALLDEIDRAAGVIRDPGMTAAEVRQQMVREGVREEENEASRELLRMRYGSEDEGQGS